MYLLLIAVQYIPNNGVCCTVYLVAAVCLMNRLLGDVSLIEHSVDNINLTLIKHSPYHHRIVIKHCHGCTAETN